VIDPQHNSPEPHPFEADCEQIRAQLVKELAAGTVQLPGFPDVALAVQRVLNDDRSDIDEIAQAVNVEPTLAMQILRIANSAAFNVRAEQVRDVRVAIQRVGTRLVRAAALAFVVQQLRHLDDLRALRERINAQWRRGVVVGAIAKALSSRVRVVEPDTALLAGLLHVVGRLFILTCLNRKPWMLDEVGVAERLMEQMGNQVSVALLTNWEMPEEFSVAIAAFDNPDRNQSGELGLTDILNAAVVLADLLPPSRTDYLDQIHLASVFMQTEPLWLRLGMTREHCSDALHIALEEVQQLRAMFGA
jgi:HD-like signal output (HDOD) protein